MKKQILYILLFSSLFSAAQNPLVKMWDKRFGGLEDDQFHYFLHTKDGGYLLGGATLSGIGGDKTQSTIGYFDYWIVKIDSVGNKQWDKDFGGTDADNLFALCEAKDGGFVIGGSSKSGISGDKSQPVWGIPGTDRDYWIVKVDSMGNKQWDKNFGGTNIDQLLFINQTIDGGYILAGNSSSYSNGDKTVSGFGNLDYWIIKIDSLGNKQWDNAYGGTEDDLPYFIQQDTSGSYFLAGHSSSGISGNKSQPTWGFSDYWVLKLDSSGNKLWDRDFGGTNDDVLTSVGNTSEGGFVLAGYSSSGISGDKTQSTWSGSSDYWIIKIDSVGNKVWDKDFGGTLYEYVPRTVLQTEDGGYLVAGSSYSNLSGDKSENNLGSMQSWFLKLDSSGNKIWDKTVFTGYSGYETFAAQTKDGCYTIANNTHADIAGYKSQPNWNNSNDFWIIKFCDTTITTNISNQELTNDHLILWPNPTTGELIINSEELKIDHIEIFNALGDRLHYETTNCESCTVNCEFLPPGIYLFENLLRRKNLL